VECVTRAVHDVANANAFGSSRAVAAHLATVVRTTASSFAVVDDVSAAKCDVFSADVRAFFVGAVSAVLLSQAPLLTFSAVGARTLPS
jgi:hypothetical protein